LTERDAVGAPSDQLKASNAAALHPADVRLAELHPQSEFGGNFIPGAITPMMVGRSPFTLIVRPMTADSPPYRDIHSP
jgi:hypothetical protein